MTISKPFSNFFGKKTVATKKSSTAMGFFSSDAEAEERKEVEDLKAMFGHSEVPRGLYIKYEVSRLNRLKADKCREEKEERQRLKEERAIEQKRRIDELREVRGERDREAIARLHEFNRQYATKLKQNEKQWEEDILRQKMALQQKVRSQAPSAFC